MFEVVMMERGRATKKWRTKAVKYQADGGVSFETEHGPVTLKGNIVVTEIKSPEPKP